jgi:glycosyltransferase involved in cell wall biosynthesis
MILKNNTNPKISIIIVTYNRDMFIREALDSALAQSYTDWEIIVLDDASEDTTGDIVKEYTNKDSRIKYYKNDENMGIAKTRNTCLYLARGIYIAPLDSDDTWLDKDKLKKQVEFLDANPDYALLGGGIMHVNTKSEPVKKVLFPVYDSVIRNIILQYNPFAQSTLLYRKNVAIECGGYSTEYKICDDYDLWLKIGLKYKFTNIPQILSSYRIHGGNITHTKRLTTAREILDIVKKYKSSYKRGSIAIIKAYMRILMSYIRT